MLKRRGWLNGPGLARYTGIPVSIMRVSVLFVVIISLVRRRRFRQHEDTKERCCASIEEDYHLFKWNLVKVSIQYGAS